MLLFRLPILCAGFLEALTLVLHAGERALQYRYSFHYELNSAKPPQEALKIRDVAQVLGVVHGTDNAFRIRMQEVTSGDRGPTLEAEHVNSQSKMRLDRVSSLEPNVSDKTTVVNLAKMTSDAYLENPDNPNWFNTSFGFNFTERFGWREDGVRGHIFANEDNSMAVVSFKGTTIYPRDHLSERDRINDVSLFSCCCGAQHPYHYSPVCNCSSSSYQCNSECLTSAILQNETYYDAAIFITKTAMFKFPNAKFWVVGHSLGGSIASLVGLSLGIPAVSFEAPPERLPAQRMGLLPFGNPTRLQGASTYHFGNTADPVFVGSCQGYLSTCSLAGFAFETQCHSGRRCVYDTVRDKGWHVSITNHRIETVINNVLEAYETVPNCTEVIDCIDCGNWKFT